MDAVLLLRVAAAWPLPGLGLLVLPEGMAPELAAYDLHAALAVEVLLPGGARHTAPATVEEVARSENPTPTRGLLLAWEAALELPAGTEIWLAAAADNPYAGLH